MQASWAEGPKLALKLEHCMPWFDRFEVRIDGGSWLPQAASFNWPMREGEVLDCYSQNTVQTEDGSCTPKCLLPPMSEDEALALALELLRDCSRRWHGVFHPYFHPINLAGRGSVACQNWFRQVLLTARELGLPSVNACQWLDFNDARRAVAVDVVQWDGEALVLALQAPMAVTGLTLLAPPWPGGQRLEARVDGRRCQVVDLAWEGVAWHGLVADLPAQERVVRLFDLS